MALRKVVALIVAIIAIAGCIGSCTPLLKKYRSLSNAEVKRFIDTHNVKPLAIRKLGEGTIILYETKSELGYYVLSIDEEGTMSKSHARTSNNSSIAPVSVGWVFTGTPFAQLIINDSTLLAKAYVAKVIFEDGYIAEEFIAGIKGHIIPHEGVSNANIPVESVAIFDEAGNILFEEH